MEVTLAVLIFFRNTNSVLFFFSGSLSHVDHGINCEMLGIIIS